MTENSKKNLIMSLSIIGGAVLIAGAIVYVGQTVKIGENPGTAALVQPEESSAVIPIEGESILGDPNAKVLIVEVNQSCFPAHPEKFDKNYTVQFLLFDLINLATK